MKSFTEVPWWKPESAGTEIDRVTDVIRRDYLNEGDVTTEFEEKIAKFCGTKYCIAVTSGTSALYLSLMALGIGFGDEVIVPDMTFVATANAVTMTGAKVVLIDVDRDTLTMCPVALAEAISANTKAIIPVHVSGRPGTLLEVMEIAKNKKIPVIEDAAEALGSKFEGSYLGSFGITGIFSLSPFKTISSGQGGLIVTNDKEVAIRLAELKDQGRPVRGTGGDDSHPSIGFNFKYTNLQAAVGLAQLEEIDFRLKKQRHIHEFYRKSLDNLTDINLLPFDTEKGEVPLWSDAIASDRNKLVEYLEEKKIFTRRFWHPIHTHKSYLSESNDFPVSSELACQAMWLPSAYQLSDEQLNYVSKEIVKFYG
jgi:perosamine synthetase